MLDRENERDQAVDPPENQPSSNESAGALDKEGANAVDPPENQGGAQ
jgi:hypothetical protein